MMDLVSGDMITLYFITFVPWLTLQVKQLLERDQKGHVLATCRNPDQSNGLQELKTQFSDRLNLLKLDVTVESTIEVWTFCLFPLILRKVFLVGHC